MDWNAERLFLNTQEAVSYGEYARENGEFEKMMELFVRLQKIFYQYSGNMAFNVQMFNEACHAFRGDEWYEGYLRSLDHH